MDIRGPMDMHGPMMRLFGSFAWRAVAGPFIAFAVIRFVGIEDFADQLMVMACCVVPVMFVYLFFFAGPQLGRDFQRQAEKEEGDWDRLVNAVKRTPDTASESN
jgi:hypothetical protein